MALVELSRVTADLVRGSCVVLPYVVGRSARGLRDGQIVYFEGRSAVQDGGGGLFKYKKDSDLPVDDGVVFTPSAGGGQFVRMIQSVNSENQVVEALDVRWFGAKGDGSINTDDTAAVLACYNSAKSRTLFWSIKFSPGRYVTKSSFLFKDVYFGTILFEGATLIGASLGADNSQQAVLEVQNCLNADFKGSCTITVKSESGSAIGNPNAYISGLLVRARPGGVIEPLAGKCSFSKFDGFTTVRIGNGFRIGEVDNDAQTSEITFSNCCTPFTVNPVQIAGSQTLIAFNGSTLASNLVEGITNAEHATIVQDGGGITLSSCNVEQHSDTLTRMVLMRPAKSALYGNPYGQVVLSGCCIETVAPFVQISNANGFAAPSSFMSRFSLIGCTGGYIGEIPLDSIPVDVYDSSWAGTISIPDGSSFYAQSGSADRNVPCVRSASPGAKIVLGKTVFDTGTGFRKWPYNVEGGTLVHDEVLALAAKTSGLSIPSGSTGSYLPWNINSIDTARMGRYQGILNSTTGAITVPNLGIRKVRIECTVALDAVSISGYIQLYRNGGLFMYGNVGSGVATLNCTVSDPVPGDVFAIRLVNLSAGSSTANPNQLCVYLET